MCIWETLCPRTHFSGPHSAPLQLLAAASQPFPTIIITGATHSLISYFPFQFYFSTKGSDMGDSAISTWTRFHTPASKPVDTAFIFRPLVSNSGSFRYCFYGPVLETPGDWVLLIVWTTYRAYDTFTKSAEHEQLLTNFKALSPDEPVTQAIDFGKIAFWWRLGPNTELRTVYFPASVSSQSREAVSSLQGLVTSMGFGIDGSGAHLSPYTGVPTCGWIDGPQNWDGQDAAACLWCQYWTNREAEEKFKTTHRRPPKDGETYRPLALEAFEQDLKSLGAIGWEECHVDFERVPNVI